MIKNYFKIAWRNLIKNKGTSLINIGGLAIGLAVAIIIMLWVGHEYSYNKFHEHLPNIHVIMQNEKQGGEIYTTQSVPGPLAASLRSEIPGIKYTARITYPSQHLIKAGDKSIYENGIYAEPDYFNMATFPAVAGNPVKALEDPGSVILTERTAKKIFGSNDPLGKLIMHNNIHPLKVAAVVKDVPSNSSFTFDVVLPFSIYEKENSGWINRWDHQSLLTWVELQPKTNLQELNEKLINLLRRKQNSAVNELFAYPLKDLAMYGRFKNGKPDGGRIEMLIMLSILGSFVLIIACINFMNLSTAHSERRAREVGVRKSLGASKRGLVFQFLTEAFLISFLALIAGLIIANTLLPGFNLLTDKTISFDIFNWKVWASLLTIAVFTGLFAGSYPAFVLSSFQPVKVLKGAITNKKGGSLLRKSLVTFQFVISIFLIIVTIVIYRQVQYAQERPVGYNQHNLVELPARGDMADKFTVLKTELLQSPGIKHVSAGTDDLIRFNASTNGITWPGKTEDEDFPVAITNVHYDWIKTTGIKIIEGRDFSPEYGSDSLACLINVVAAKKMGLKKPVVGTMLGDKKIVGVMEDFVYNDPLGASGPLAVFLSNGSMGHFFIRLNEGERWQKTMPAIEKAVKKINPNHPFEFHLTEEKFQQKFKGIKSRGQFASVTGVLAILISCLGLFGLSAFVAERRTKEIGVRKVLGASAGNIWFSLSKDFLKPVVLAFIIASPLAAIAMQKMLLTMDYRIQLSWWMFAVAGIIALVIAVGTVSFQATKAAIANPVKSLRTE